MTKPKVKIARVKKNLNRKTIKLLRDVQKFLLEEPRRFGMKQGLVDVDVDSNFVSEDVIERPPCGTMCCIAGAAYAIMTQKVLNFSKVGWYEISSLLKEKTQLDQEKFPQLFFMSKYHSGTVGGARVWPKFFETMYLEAKTPIERAIVGHARIEYFIATDGL